MGEQIYRFTGKPCSSCGGDPVVEYCHDEWCWHGDEVAPVERCEHGNIDGHYTRDGYEPRGWCEGAGIGDAT